MYQFEITNPARVLSAPFKTVSQAVPSKSPLPILEGILFQLTPEGLTLTGCDTEMWIVVRVGEVKLPIGGVNNNNISFVLPKKVADAILRLPDGQTLFEFHPERLNLKINYGHNFKNSQTHQLLRADDYPRIPNIQGEEFTFPVDLKRVSFSAAGPSETRIIFTGININFEARKIAACDTFRITVMDIPGEIKIPEETIKSSPKINILTRMINVIDSLEEPVFVVDSGGGGGNSSNLIMAKSEDTTIISRLIPGQYPRLSPVVSQVENPLFVVEFSSREMIDTLNRVAPILSSGKAPKFTFRGGDGIGGGGGDYGDNEEGFISISAQSESGTVTEDIPCKIVSQWETEKEKGKILTECLFDVKFVNSALKYAVAGGGSDRVTWGLNGQYGASVIRAADGGGDWDGKSGSGAGDGWLCVVVPGLKEE